MKKHSYREYAFHYFTPFLAGFLISMYGHWNEVGRAFRTPMFYVSLTISTAVAGLFMFLVQKINNKLNNIYPWERNIWIRLLLQIVFGVGLPGLLEFLFFTLYFTIQGQDISTNDFIYYDFPFAMGFICLLNIYHVGNKENDVNNDSDFILIKRYGKVTKVSISQDVLYVKRSAKGVHIFTKADAKYNQDYSLAEFLKLYEKNGLLQINRSVLINKTIIEGYDTGPSYGTLQLDIKPEYQNLESMRDQNLFVVTKKEVETFKREFAKP